MIVPVVLLVIGVILMFLLRSVVAAALLLAANVLSFAAALGVSAIVFNHVLGFAGADPVVPLFAFVFLVALGVDYSIFLMTRVREESLKVGTRAGVVRGLAVTGGVITSAGVVLATTFAALGVIPLLFLAQIAFIVAFGVLLDTLVVRSLLVPALVHDLGPPDVVAQRAVPAPRARSAQGRARPRVRRMEALRVGLVGYGGAGRGIHARLLREAGQQVTVRGHPQPRGSRSRRTGPEHVVVPDVDGLLAHADELDLVVIASPTGEHVAHVLAALDAGSARARRQAAGHHRGRRRAARVARRRAAHRVPEPPLGHRAADPARGARRADELGTVHRFERRWERFRPVPQDRWKENDPDSGGLLLDLGAHLVDSAVQLFGPVAQVYAELHARSTPAVDDVFLALVHAGNGVVSHLQAGAVVGAPGPRTRVLGDGGAYLVTSFEGEPTPFAALDDAYEETRRPGEPVHEGWLVRGADRQPVPQAAGGHVDVYRAVVRWVVDGGPPPVDPADAARTARVLDAALVSAAERRVVQLP